MSKQYSQSGRIMSVLCPSKGQDFFLLETFSGNEEISRPYRYQLEMLLPSDADTDFASLLGQPAAVTLEMPDSKKRYFHGMVARFAQGDQIFGPNDGIAFNRYRAEIVPKFWFLTRRIRSRIFQQMSVPDILRKVLEGCDATIEVQGTFEPRDYCVQYRESDFDFASRLMEEEGIYYYFTHTDSSHAMIVANVPASHRSVVEQATIEFEAHSTSMRDFGQITTWEKVQEVRSVMQVLWDHSFEMPDKNLEAKSAIQQSVQVGTVSHSLRVARNEALEIYDYPGGYAQRFDGVDPGGADQASVLQKIFQDNVRTVGIRMQEEAAQSIIIHGESDCRQFAAGHKFTLSNHFTGDGDYVITSVRHYCTQAGAYTSSKAESRYENQFDAIPFALPFRPVESTPKAVVPGTHTATVVGSPGEEIFTDKYGRVKVQFHWDRDGKKDANSSCWVRVGTPWAGKQWGMIHIPRVGQEVIVAFEEGDPDQPIIVGSVYNAEQMPPYTLPDKRTQSGLKTRSSLQGDEQTFNELRFEDKLGSEEIYLHAQKDFNRVVENNETIKVGFETKDKGDRTVEVFNSEKVTIGAGKGQAAEGSQTLSIYKDRTTTIETGNETFTIKMGNQTTEIKAGSSKTEAMQSIELIVGQNSIKIDQMGVTIKGLTVTVEGTVQMNVKGALTNVTATGICSVGGSMLKLG